jgi:hypothetical protein
MPDTQKYLLYSIADFFNKAFIHRPTKLIWA